MFLVKQKILSPYIWICFNGPPQTHCQQHNLASSPISPLSQTNASSLWPPLFRMLIYAGVARGRVKASPIERGSYRNMQINLALRHRIGPQILRGVGGL